MGELIPFQTRLTPETKQTIEAYRDRTGLSLAWITRRLLEKFAALPDPDKERALKQFEA